MSLCQGPAEPGHHSSDRYSAQWFLYQFAVTRWVIIAIGMALVAFTQFHYLLYAFWAALGVGLLYEVFAFVYQTALLASMCNIPGLPWNICNDYRYCCRNYAQPEVSCYNTTGCDYGVIGPNADFCPITSWASVSRCGGC
ncbi:hypothetical protein U1Q18_051625 [Sarracenia purpurea var. burkii]